MNYVYGVSKPGWLETVLLLVSAGCMLLGSGYLELLRLEGIADRVENAADEECDGCHDNPCQGPVLLVREQLGRDQKHQAREEQVGQHLHQDESNVRLLGRHFVDNGAEAATAGG